MGRSVMEKYRYVRQNNQSLKTGWYFDTYVKVDGAMAQLPKGGLVRGHDKPIDGSCAIYFRGGIL